MLSPLRRLARTEAWSEAKENLESAQMTVHPKPIRCYLLSSWYPLRVR
jgi:hypothetical protein